MRICHCGEMQTAEPRSGAPLEQLVAFIEAELAGPAFTVTTNERRFNSKGRPIAEFDIVVRGKIGSGNIAWLIECRDREEKAGVDWIQQLPTRRHDHRFDKVTAVSTSGFTEPAIECARLNNVELRTMTDLPPPDLLTWLRIPTVAYSSKTTAVHGVTVHLDPTSLDLATAVNTALGGISTEPAIFKHNDQRMTCDQFFLACVRQRWSLFDDVTPNGPDKLVQLDVTFDPPTAVKLITGAGDASIARVVFSGELRHRQGDALLQDAKDYIDATNDERISQTAVFSIPELGSAGATVEAHTFAESGMTQFVFKTLPLAHANEIAQLNPQTPDRAAPAPRPSGMDSD